MAKTGFFPWRGDDCEGCGPGGGGAGEGHPTSIRARPSLGGNKTLFPHKRPAQREHPSAAGSTPHGGRYLQT